MKSRSVGIRVTPTSNNSFGEEESRHHKHNHHKRSLFPRKFRTVRSTLTTATTTSSFEDSSEQRGDDSSVLFSTSDFGTEVMVERDAATLHELALHEYKMKRIQEALDCWNQALWQMRAKQQEDDLKLAVLWHLLKVHLELKETDNKGNEDETKEIFDELKPHLSSLTSKNLASLEPSALMLDYFVANKEWAGAVQLASQLHVDSALMARIHYERGIQASASTSVRMDCMTKCLACQGCSTRLKLAALAELVQLHSASGNYLIAMQHHEERLGLLENKSDIAKAFFEEGELYIGLGHKEKALASIEKGLELQPKSLTLLEAKGDLLFLLGEVDESLKLHEEVLEHTKDPTEQMTLLYTMGRICHKSGRGDRAVQYYERELAITKEIFGESHLECSRIYHELARLYDEACNYDMALKYLRSALAIEQETLGRCKQAERKREMTLLIRETQKFIGKIYFKTGDLNGALQASFGDLLPL